MKNIPPIGTNLPVSSTGTASVVEKISAAAEKISETATEASVLSLPKARAPSGDASGVEAVLGSFLSGLKSDNQLGAAHSGLDPSRVADLLSDD